MLLHLVLDSSVFSIVHVQKIFYTPPTEGTAISWGVGGGGLGVQATVAPIRDGSRKKNCIDMTENIITELAQATSHKEIFTLNTIGHFC